MKLAIVGTGYVGLVSGLGLAEAGHVVTCVDSNPDKVRRISLGECPIHEDGLQPLLAKHLGDRFFVTQSIGTAIGKADITMIAVGTPFDGKQIDLTQIESAANAIGQVLREKNGYHVVVVKSTVVPGTTDGLVRSKIEKASGKKAGRDLGLAMNPEFLREGAAVADFMNPDRIVIGGIDARSIEAVKALYQPFMSRGVPVVETNCATAELIKYTNNAFFAGLISFSNEIANMCARLPSVDVQNVMSGVHADHRLSPRLESGEAVRPRMLDYLLAGCGFGGSCFPKDVKALAAYARTLAVEPRMLSSIVDVNDAQPLEMIAQMESQISIIPGCKVAILGLAFKPESDDVRESPAIALVENLIGRGCLVTAYDPEAMNNFRAHRPDLPVAYCQSVDEAVVSVEAILLVTSWTQFRVLPELIRKCARQPLVVDGRRMFQSNDFSRYAAIGFMSRAV